MDVFQDTLDLQVVVSNDDALTWRKGMQDMKTWCTKHDGDTINAVMVHCDGDEREIARILKKDIYKIKSGVELVEQIVGPGSRELLEQFAREWVLSGDIETVEWGGHLFAWWAD